MAEAFPLSWPEGWPRTQYGGRLSDAKFHGKTYGLSMGRARDQLLAALKLLGAANVVLSTNVALRGDGLPYANARVPQDPGVAVYFTLQKRQLVMARDKYRSVAGNLRSLTLALEAMRQIQNHGGSQMMERAFSGFAALTPPSWKKPWREVFGVKPDWAGDIKALYREKAQHRHPDAGGASTIMAELNVAYDEAKADLGVR